MKNRPGGLFSHSISMVGTNLRSYSMLSVTIFLSFSILLGFMVYSDSDVFNRYKPLFKASPEVVVFNWLTSGSIGSQPDNSEVLKRYGMMMEQLDKMDGTHYCLFADYSGNSGSTSRDGVNYVDWKKSLSIFFVSDMIWPFYTGMTMYDQDEYSELGYEKLYHVSGSERFTGSAQIMLDEDFYGQVAADIDKEGGKIVLDLGFLNGSAGKGAEVVGLFSEDDAFSEMYSGYPRAFMPLSAVGDMAALEENGTWYLYVHSENIANVIQVGRSLELLANAYPYTRQQAAVEKILGNIQIRTVITVLLYLILGVNLYGSFENALLKRRFEIGVKRAIGAGRGAIIRQFFYEGIIVTFANLMLSVSFVLSVFLSVKLFFLYSRDMVWTVYITPYSALTFAAASIFLSAVFSIIFAYRSANVEIVKFIKEK